MGCSRGEGFTLLELDHPGGIGKKVQNGGQNVFHQKVPSILLGFPS